LCKRCYFGFILKIKFLGQELAVTDISPPSSALREFTLRGLILGALITVVFTAANIYLGLKVGLTFASSIPAAVISMAVLRAFGRTNILENNIVQTIASAAGTLSSIIFVLPGLVLVGYWTGFPFWQTSLICMIGGTMGVMFTVPLRRAMVVESDLLYPEGVAAAEILKVGSRINEGEDLPGQPGINDVAIGTGLSGAFALASSGFAVLAGELNGFWRVGQFTTGMGASLSLALIGVGYLVGIIGGLAMLIGVLIAWWVAVPILSVLHPNVDGLELAAYAVKLWRQVRFIGAGLIAVSAIWALITLLKPMLDGMRASFAALAAIRSGHGDSVPLTERDIPFDQVAYVSLFLLVPLTCVFAYFIGQSGVFSSLEQWGIAAAASVFTFVIGFVVATACGYMAGLIGSSNSPISGIAIIAVISAGLLLIVLLGRGLDQPEIQKQAIAIALFATAAVLAVATISNDNLQDLKTGQLVGATPARQQWALVIGSVVGSLVIPPILELVYQAYGFAGALPHEGMDPTRALGAPQATVMSALATGLITGKLDWTMLTIGVGLGVVLIGIDSVLKRTTKTASLPPLAVGLGIYLPSAVSTPIALGAIIAWATDRQLKKRAAAAGQDFEAYAELPRRRGTLLASGLIVGESLVGVVLAALIVAADSQTPIALVGESFVPIADWLGGGVFLIVCWDIYRRVLKH
jgi:putative OPT family oligopeptide transporter